MNSFNPDTNKTNKVTISPSSVSYLEEDTTSPSINEDLYSNGSIVGSFSPPLVNHYHHGPHRGTKWSSNPTPVRVTSSNLQTKSPENSSIQQVNGISTLPNERLSPSTEKVFTSTLKTRESKESLETVSNSQNLNRISPISTRIPVQTSITPVPRVPLNGQLNPLTQKKDSILRLKAPDGFVIGGNRSSTMPDELDHDSFEPNKTNRCCTIL